MSLPGLSGEELLAWVERTSQEWRSLLSGHPEALAIPCDIRETTHVGGLLQHIVAVELRYAERLHGLEETPYEAVPSDSVEAIYQTHDKAMKLLRALDDRSSEYWEEFVSFATRRGGSISTSRRTIYIHLLMHSIRHYAQLATIVRKNGIAPQWQMDYLLMGVRQPQP